MNFSYQPIVALLTTVVLIAGCTAESEEALQEDGSNSSPSISGTPPTSVMAGNAYSFTPSASDPDGDNLSFSIANRPTWASFDTNSGRLSGTPGQGSAGTTSGIVITASDGQLSSSLAAFSVTVQNSSSNSSPTISGNPPATATVNQQYDFTPTASDPDGDTLTFSISNRPSWATFTASNGQLAGTPGSGDVGTFSNIAISVSDGSSSASLTAFSITVQSAGGGNTAPAISGAPPTQVTQDTSYSFQPTASDADGDQLSFSINNQPAWSNFDTATGLLSGTPTAGDVGTYTGIVISVTDGMASTALPGFTIDVVAVALGSATLSWTAPTLNDDDTTLTDLAGFKIYWGTSPGSYPNSVTLNNPGLTTYVVDNLVPNTYYFVATAFNSTNVESRQSAVTQQTVQ